MGHPLPFTAKNVRVSYKFVTDLALATQLLQARPRRLQQKLHLLTGRGVGGQAKVGSDNCGGVSRARAPLSH